jgi:hypothetical protein
VKRTNTPTGSKFTVRGQVYIQTGAFFHPMSNDREVRVLELDTTCPECSETFQATASMRQIRTRQLVRRCQVCRELHSGPVRMPPAPRKSAERKLRRKTALGWKRARLRAAEPERRPTSSVEAIPDVPPKILPSHTDLSVLD